MSLTNAMKVAPAASSTGEGVQDKSEDPEKPKETETVFSKYSEYVDTAAGTIKFKDKAIIHGSGIDFSGGSSFSISLDEVDTLDELGKGNYGTVYCVRHSRPRVRRRGLGLAGNKDPHSSAIAKTADTSSTQRDGTTGLVMAMKEIRLELDDAKFAAIIMELDVLHRCVSPFIVDFYGAFFQEGAVYICMEFMDGGSIDKLYGDGIPENVLRKIVLSSVMGLKSLKDDHNIIHRDVKPTNILVNTRGQVKICDFGVSGNLVASIAKTNIGCQSYMAPERIAGGGIAQAGANPGGGTYSVQSDIWSLGLTVVECAMGRYPYPPETYNNIFSQLSVSLGPFSIPSNLYLTKCRPSLKVTPPVYQLKASLQPLTTSSPLVYIKFQRADQPTLCSYETHGFLPSCSRRPFLKTPKPKPRPRPERIQPPHRQRLRLSSRLALRLRTKILQRGRGQHWRRRDWVSFGIRRSLHSMPLHWTQYQVLPSKVAVMIQRLSVILTISRAVVNKLLSGQGVRKV